ncbi:HET-domain-containing protein [Acephala macrosclerotiorum]|nr:HET-domain-containing protein [Acephala macrosclerotiorum]
MRLLELNDNGDLSLIERASGSIPEYAILSHTWGPDGDEVIYEDLIQGTGKHKPGYEKIRFCAKQAERDGLKYFWIDTCCINKANFTELSEAINSMFRWYRKATRCYVYLSDVPEPQNPTSTVEAAFPNSRWFKRGWTLQELIAPSVVQFFSRTGKFLGDKTLLEQQIHQITGIAIEALRGSPLSEFESAERLSWAARRETTVEEDAAYCLLGIFDIHMPLIYGEGRRKALERLQREVQLSSNAASLAPIDSTWIVPFRRNPSFTGRQSQLAQLEEMLFAKDHTAKIAITGLGGVGKTQLVLELLYRTKEKHNHFSIIWIPAISLESLYQAYLDIARQLGIPGWEGEKADVKKLVQDYLSRDSAGQWLLVFDNADDDEMWFAEPGPEKRPRPGRRGLVDYLPRSKQGCVIFTTRNRKVAVKLAQQNVVEVPEMDEEVATQLLQKCLLHPDIVHNQRDTAALLAELTYLPLAIVQAAAYINENGIVLSDYLSLLVDQEEVVDLLSEEFEDDGRYREARNPVAMTWLILFEQIRRRNSLAADYLSFMACVDPRDIPQSLLPPGPSRKKEIDAIGTLHAYAFITRRPANLALDLHRLVHLATRNWLRKEGTLTQSANIAIVRLEEIFPDDDNKNRSVWRMYLPHARYTLESDLVNKDGEIWLDLMWRYGVCLYRDGRWNEAEASFTQVLETQKTVLGVDHPNTLASMANIALTYNDQGRWDQAKGLFVQVIEISKRVLGAVSTYENQGRWNQAEELSVQVMETSKRVLGLEHPHTLISMANLASIYKDQGRWDEAEKLFVQVVMTSKRVFGAEHPNTFTSINNLTITREDMGRDTESIKLMKDCV